MIKGTQKVVYLDNDIIEEIQKRKGSFSRNVNDLIRKGLKLESNSKELGIRGHIEGLVKLYNEKSKNPIII
jgi:hypothetical protein